MSTDTNNDLEFATDPELVAQYLGYAGGAVTDMRETINGARADRAFSDDAIQMVYGVAHNLKGMGASFNYPLISHIGNSFCRYIKHKPEDVPVDVDLVDLHVRALELVLEHEISGQGGTRGNDLIGALQSLVNTALLPDAAADNDAGTEIPAGPFV